MQYGEWYPRYLFWERRAWLHPVWGDHGFERRWRRFGFVRWLADLIRQETVIEQTTDTAMKIVQTVRRRDGSEYARRLDA